MAIVAIVAFMTMSAMPMASAQEDKGEWLWVLFDFGDGRWTWADVDMPEPANAWCATVAAAEDVDFDLEYSFSQFGIFLESVDGVDTPMDFSRYWGLWSWNGTTSRWDSSSVGALDLDIQNVSAVAWRFGAFGDPAPSPDPLTLQPWTAFRGGRSIQGDAGPYGPSAGALFWSVDLQNGPIDSTMAVANGKVFGTTSGIFDWNLFEFRQLPTVFALDSDTGELLWEYEFHGSGGFEIGSPAYAGGIVYTTTSSRSVIALDATDGGLLWETSVDDVGLSSSPSISGGKVLVGTGSGKLMALKTSNGDIYWTANVSGWVYLAAPTVHDGIVYIGTDNGTLHAIDLNDGREIWTVELGGKVRGTPLVAGERIYAISAIYPGFVATEGFLHALDLDGNKLWNVSIGPTGSSPAISGELVLVGSKSGLWAIDMNGTVTWRYEDAGQISASPAVTDWLIYIMSNENDTTNGLHTSVIALAPDGKVWWNRVLEPHNWALSSASVSGCSVYVATDSGWVYALGDTTYIPDFKLTVDGLRITLTDASLAVGRNITSFRWDIYGDDRKVISLEGERVTYEFTKAGEYRISLTIGDEFNIYITTERTVEVEEPGFSLLSMGAMTILAIVLAVVTLVVVGFLLKRGR